MNDLTRKLGISLPFIQGGMGNISHAELAVAVSEAGGLGTIGAGTLSPNYLEDMIIKIRKQTSKPFAINVPLSVQKNVDELIKLIIGYQIPVVSLSAGNPAPFITKLKNENIIVICVVANERQAIKAEEEGADFIVAEGVEAAGINAPEELTTFTLVPKICDSVAIPVIAAGGIGDGRGVLAAMSLGAQGVQLGTRLIATKDAKVHSLYKRALCAADSDGTMIVGRSYGKIRRILKTPYGKHLLEEERNNPDLKTYLDITDENHHILGALEGKFLEGHVNAGQVASIINDIPTVKELFQRMIQEAQTLYNHQLPFGKS
ncbi:nitronate monooxygenase family protein [Virgibacillus salarius]|uniref:NAD(P)H-dependent flavin oxidoreductase n=1 Tax=Virgibacillus salarius TaxID=447199 RepID=UPI0024922185|nr:nitronate monooxygenase family protein [Virgibacillus salarius]WBX80883.1 nitronate monooxygenase family protein [Virgibacillus salarius]